MIGYSLGLCIKIGNSSAQCIKIGYSSAQCIKIGYSWGQCIKIGKAPPSSIGFHMVFRTPILRLCQSFRG